jgi:YD repeat-containing protein
MANRKSTQVYRTDLVNVGIGQGQMQSVPYLASQTDYDTESRVIMQCSYSASGVIVEKTVFEYDANGRLVHEIYYTGEPEPAEENTYEYDEQGKVCKEFKHYIDGSKDTTDYAYDDSGKLVGKVTVDEDGETELREVFEYKGEQLVSHVIADGEDNPVVSEEFGYNDKGQVIMQIRNDNETGEYFKLMVEYNEDGRKVSEKIYDEEDELVETTWFEEDENGRVIQTVEENSLRRHEKHFFYDDQGNGLGYEEVNQDGDKVVVVEHQLGEHKHPVASMVFVHGAGRSPGQHYELNYEYSWYE